MTRTVVQPLPHDLAVLARLGTITTVVDAVVTPVPVGFGEAPVGALEGVQAKTGPDYMILYPLNSNRDGNLGDPWSEADFVYQVTCVGRTAAGVRWLVGKLETALLTVTVTGRAVTQVVMEDDGTVRPDFDLDPQVIYATPRLRIQTVPT